jgi:hypothetical protein
VHDRERLGGRCLLRRVLRRWVRGNGRLRAAARHRARATLRSALHRWRRCVRVTRALVRLSSSSTQLLARRALAALAAAATEGGRRARTLHTAAAARGKRGLVAAFHAWRRRARAVTHVALSHGEEGSAAALAADRQRARALLGYTLRAWRAFFVAHSLPKCRSRRRAARADRQRLLRRGWAALRRGVVVAACKSQQLARCARRCAGLACFLGLACHTHLHTGFLG